MRCRELLAARAALICTQQAVAECGICRTKLIAATAAGCQQGDLLAAHRGTYGLLDGGVAGLPARALLLLLLPAKQAEQPPCSRLFITGSQAPCSATSTAAWQCCFLDSARLQHRAGGALQALGSSSSSSSPSSLTCCYALPSTAFACSQPPGQQLPQEPVTTQLDQSCDKVAHLL